MDDVAMNNVPVFRTFDEMAAVLSVNTPHALVQDWWSRLERAIVEAVGRAVVTRRPAISRIISTELAQLPGISRDLVDELQQMRALRNRCAHGEAPSISALEAHAFAHRAWTIARDLAETTRVVV
jgi:hypothetical protein